MRSGRSPSARTLAALASLACLVLACAICRASLFPQLSQRYPVGDPTAGNPLDPNREGPKCLDAGDFNGDRVGDLVVGNLDGSISMLLADGSEGLREQLLFRAGGSIRSVAAADLDRDGALDVVAADITEGIVVLLGNGDGSLRLSGNMKIGPARSIAVSDVDRDGVPDILVGLSTSDCDQKGSASRALCILLGKGDGSFGEPRFLIQDTAGCLYDVALADLDGDGFVDALALDYTLRTILVFAGKGDGTFAPLGPGPELVGIQGGGPRAFSVAYLDERTIDGAPPPGATLDVVVANRETASLDIFLGLGGFAFSKSIPVSCGSSPRSVAAGDLNGDGLQELVVTNRDTNTLSVLRGLGEGRFSVPLEVAAGVSPRDLVLADLTGDGNLDAAVVNRISGDVSLFTGRRGLAGFLVPERYYPAGITPVGVVAVDFDEDGLPDAATVNLRSHDVRVRRNVGGGDLGEETVYPVNYQPSCMVSGDLDGDGHLDLLSVCMGSSRSTDSASRGSLVALLGSGDGTFDTKATIAGDRASFQPYWLRVGDLSGDGILDAVAGGRSGELVLFKGLGDGTFDRPVVLPSGLEEVRRGLGSPLTMALGDFDGNGLTDIATSAGRVLLNDGRLFDSDWSGKVNSFPVERGDWVVETADLDRDGILDLIVALTFVQPDPIAVHFGVGDGTFLPPTIYETGMGVVSLQAADMDGDGVLDIVSGNRCTADVTIMKGLGDRRFERLETTTTYSVEGVAVADMNGDGKPDLVGAGLALWVLLSGEDSRLDDPKDANPAGIVPVEGVYINELMASNDRSFIDERGKTPDWLELYNHGSAPMDLSGWILRQQTRDGIASDWAFPQGSVVERMGHLVVFCDGGEPGQGLHASFALNADGESVSLLDPKGKAMDTVDFPAVPKDVSYARFVDGARYLSYNPVPTMGSANVKPANLSPSVAPRNPFLASGGRMGITARTFDDIGLAYASVHFRLEGDPSFSEVVLADDGAHGDGRPGDGDFGAVLPSFPAGSTVLCYLRVVDLDGEVSTAPGDPNIATDLFRFTVPPRERGLRIAEALAANSGGDDWLEITNCGSEAQSLEGLGLTKDYFDSGKAWMFPRMSLDPGERVLVTCDNQPETGPLHASFRLDTDGDDVLLVRPAGTSTVLDSISFGPLAPDTSFGIPDCGGEAVVLARPTPGEPNAGPGVPFVRGDSNADGDVDIGDAIHFIWYLFLGGEAPACLNASDIDDSGALDITDALYLLGYLYLNGPPPEEPFERCGIDAVPEDLSCGSYPPGCPR